MENRNQTIIIGLLALIAGLIIGYLSGGNTMMSNQWPFSNDSMYEEMEEHIDSITYEDDSIIDGDGELMHMMDEMLLIGRGKTGEAYEKAWLRGMVAHHLGAIAMSEKLLEQTNRPELIELANTIIENQEAEIEQMKKLLTMWFNEN